MMNDFLLDTNVCIGYLKGHVAIWQRLSPLPRATVMLCDIVKLELYYGAYKSTSQEKNLAVLEKFFREFKSLPFNEPAVIKCAQLRAQLEKKGTPIGPYDLQIAAIALVNNLVLVTHNTREFSRVEGLRIEDWEAEQDGSPYQLMEVLKSRG
jgi:tRNA(fMet)-specific endonuclease VapC